jgi:hypothetical protein
MLAAMARVDITTAMPLASPQATPIFALDSPPPAQI